MSQKIWYGQSVKYPIRNDHGRIYGTYQHLRNLGLLQVLPYPENPQNDLTFSVTNDKVTYSHSFSLTGQPLIDYICAINQGLDLIAIPVTIDFVGTDFAHACLLLIDCLNQYVEFVDPLGSKFSRHQQIYHLLSNDIFPGITYRLIYELTPIQQEPLMNACYDIVRYYALLRKNFTDAYRQNIELRHTTINSLQLYSQMIQQLKKT